MSSHNKKPTINSRQARPRALTSLTQHLSDARGLVADRIARARSHSTQTHRLSEKQQKALLDAVVSSTTFHVPQYHSSAPSKAGLGDPSVDPRSLSLGSGVDSLGVARPDVSSVTSGPTPTRFVEAGEVGGRVLSLGDVDNQTMSAATYMMPAFGQMDPYHSHYQSGYQAGSSYVSDEPQSVAQSSPHTTASYATSYTTSPALMNESPRLSQQQNEKRPHRPSYPGSYQSTTASPYLPSATPGQGSYGFTSPAGHSSQFASHTPTVHSQEVGASGYSSGYSLPHASYNTGSYDSSNYQTVPGTTAGYVPAQVVSTYPPAQAYVVSSSSELASASEDSGVRILNSRPKPQCWDHGCNGRQFSTFSNLLRHQREKSGTAAKSTCPRCGAEFTRTTARNGHMAHDKCKRKSTTSSTGE